MATSYRVWIARVQLPSGDDQIVSVYARNKYSVQKLIERDYGRGSIISGPVPKPPKRRGPGLGKILAAHTAAGTIGVAIGYKIGRRLGG